MAFDLPTQIGYDSDAPQADGEVGKVGVAIDTLADMELLFDGIPLDKVSTSMTINAPAAVLLAMYIAVAEKQGAKRTEISGTIQNDILKEYIARGTYIFPPRPSMRLITDIFAYCAREVPKWNTISISGYHIREAGSTAAQEVGFTLADGIAYVAAALEAGLDVDAFAGQLSFFFNAHNDLLEEVAKYRAARRLWARIVKERFGAKQPKSMMLRFHAQTAGSTLTAQQVDNNIVRVTIQTLAAILGGAQSLHTNSRDEALAQRDPDRLLGRQRERFVPRVRVQALGPAQDRGERLERDAHDVVVHLLRRQRRAGRLGVEPEHHRFRLLRAEPFLHDARPEPARGPVLRHLFEKIVVRVEEERELAREGVHIQAGLERRVRHRRSRRRA